MIGYDFLHNRMQIGRLLKPQDGRAALGQGRPEVGIDHRRYDRGDHQSNDKLDKGKTCLIIFLRCFHGMNPVVAVIVTVCPPTVIDVAPGGLPHSSNNTGATVAVIGDAKLWVAEDSPGRVKGVV